MGTIPREPTKLFASSTTTTSADERVFVVPYDAHGKLAKTKPKMYLDLNVGSRIEIVNHNIEGAGQPSHQSMVRNGKLPRGQISRWNDTTMAIEIGMEPGNRTMLLGYWWIETAIHERTPTIPIVNINPRVVDV